ncbi:MAG TPA: class I SAM-dependent methyltransferase [bacterium]|nr:class I SAM-dependent methyltransferase [bacterium]HPN45226.1 class I SAM-dependent methyltransferase [bacterium]
MPERDIHQNISAELYSYYSDSKNYQALLQGKGPDYFADYVQLVGSYIKDKRSRVLDVGCGSALSTQLLRSAFPNTCGTDVSLLFLQLNKSDLNFVGDAHRLPVQDKTMDAVCSFEFIEHVNNAEQVLSEMIRITKSGGLVIIMSPNLFSPLIPLRSLMQYCRGKKEPSPWTPTFWSIFPLLVKNCYMIIKKKLQKQAHFEYRRPDLSDNADLGGDFDSVYLSNPVDISKFLKSKNLRILNISVGRSRVGRFLSRFMPSFASGMAIVAQKEA